MSSSTLVFWVWNYNRGTYFGCFTDMPVQPHQWKALAETFWMMWLNKGLSWKIAKIRTTPVLLTQNRYRSPWNGCFVFKVCATKSVSPSKQVYYIKDANQALFKSTGKQSLTVLRTVNKDTVNLLVYIRKQTSEGDRSWSHQDLYTTVMKLFAYLYCIFTLHWHFSVTL